MSKNVPVAYSTQEEQHLLGLSLHCAFPVDDCRCFGELLNLIDEAERKAFGEMQEQSKR